MNKVGCHPLGVTSVAATDLSRQQTSLAEKILGEQESEGLQGYSLDFLPPPRYETNTPRTISAATTPASRSSHSVHQQAISLVGHRRLSD